MQQILQHLVLLVFACGIVFLGWRTAHAPDKVYRLFTFGLTEPSRFGVAFVKTAGWCWAVCGVFGVALYLILIIVGLFRAMA